MNEPDATLTERIVAALDAAGVPRLRRPMPYVGQRPEDRELEARAYAEAVHRALPKAVAVREASCRWPYARRVWADVVRRRLDVDTLRGLGRLLSPVPEQRVETEREWLERVRSRAIDPAWVARKLQEVGR